MMAGVGDFLSDSRCALPSASLEGGFQGCFDRVQGCGVSEGDARVDNRQMDCCV